MNEAAALMCFTLGQGDPLGPEKSLHTNLTTQRDGREGITPPEMDDYMNRNWNCPSLGKYGMFGQFSQFVYMDSNDFQGFLDFL